jgi:hypothetical protein
MKAQECVSSLFKICDDHSNFHMGRNLAVSLIELLRDFCSNISRFILNPDVVVANNISIMTYCRNTNYHCDALSLRFCRWPIDGDFGDLSCKIAYMARDISKLTSAYTLTALSVDRCLATYPDLRRLRTLCAGKVICITIWIFSFLAAIPYTVYAQIDRYMYCWSFGVLMLC